jgi:hypothetical protein
MVTRKKPALGRGTAGRTAVVSEGGAHAALRRGATRELSAEEEKVMRMRLGASPARAAPLERSFEPLTDLEIEVRAAEIEAWLRWKAHAAPAARREAPGREPAPLPSRAKDRIIRALRRKG